MKIRNEGRADWRFPGQLTQILSSDIEKLEQEIRQRQLVLAARKRAQKAVLNESPAIPDLPIEMLGFSSKTVSRLRAAKVDSLKGIGRLTKSERRLIESFSRSEYSDIVGTLRELGIDLD